MIEIDYSELCQRTHSFHKFTLYARLLNNMKLKDNR